MTVDELLAQLRDIRVPDTLSDAGYLTINWWPAVIYVVLIGLAIYLTHRRKTTWRREAIQKLSTIESQIAGNDLAAAWSAFAVLVRQIAIKTQPDSDVGSRTGQVWLTRLDKIFATNAFTEGAGQAIVVVPYQPGLINDGGNRDDLKSLVSLVKAKLPHLRQSDG